MKVCSNCGAEYENGFDKCPYCGMSDSEAIQKKHKGQVKQLKSQRDYIKKLPEIIPKKSTRYLLLGGGIMLAVFLVLLLVVFVGKKIMVNHETNQQQKNIEIMEEYLVAGDYVGLDEFYGEVPYAYTVYDKYREVTEFYSQYDFMLTSLTMVYDFGGKVDKEQILDDITDAMMELRELCITADEACNDRSLMSNEQYIEEIKNMGIADFKEYFLVDDAVVEEVISEPEAEEDEIPALYTGLAEQIYDNLDKVNFGRTE